MDSLDHTLFLAINAGAEPPAALVALAVLAARFVIVLVPLHITLVWAGGDREMRTVALASVLALVTACAVNQVIGLVAYVPRPFVIGLGHTLIEHRPSSSFPSNHATVFFAYAAVLALFGRRGLALSVACLGLLVAWSRIYLGIHFPLDMLGAALVGPLAAVAAVPAVRRFRRRPPARPQRTGAPRAQARSA